MASQTGQTNTSSTNLVSALNNLDRSLLDLKGADAWLDEVESLNEKLGVENVIDRDQYKSVASNKVTFYAQSVVDAATP